MRSCPAAVKVIIITTFIRIKFQHYDVKFIAQTTVYTASTFNAGL